MLSSSSSSIVPLPSSARHRSPMDACTHAAPNAYGDLDALPNDLLQALLAGSYGSFPPTTLVALACTCKAAAAMALPILYTSILMPSLPALAHLHTVLTDKPHLACHVRSITASQYFVEVGQFMLTSDVMGDPAKLEPRSLIVSVDKSLQRCGPQLLGMLPMAWFIRLVRACPNLKSVDLSRIPDLDVAAPCLTFGLLSLARTLRKRGGRLVSSSKAPISAVAVNDLADGAAGTNNLNHSKSLNRSTFEPRVFLVTAIFWDTKQIDITNDAESVMDTGHAAIVPFADITSTQLDEQCQWTIRKAEITTQFAQAYSTSTAESAWSRYGIRKNGADRVFDLSVPNQIQGLAAVSYHTTKIDQCRAALQRRHIQPSTQCSQVFWVGGDPCETYTLRGRHQGSFGIVPQVQNATAQLTQFLMQPWHALTEFVVGNAFFLTQQNTPVLLQQMADALPNLTSLEMRNLLVPMDFVLGCMDCFLRRPAHRGALLQSLYLTVYALPRPDPMSSASGTSPRAYADRTLLDCSRPTACHLRHLSLEVEGPRPELLPHYDVPTVAIHPGLLHGLERLYIMSVKLLVVPPHLALPTSASFVPLSAFAHHPAVSQRQALLLEHVHLPNLTHLETCTHALAPLTTRAPHPHYRVPTALPRAPNLAHLLLVSTDPHHLSFFGIHVLPTLLRYPRLVRARIGFTQLTEADLCPIVRQVLCRPGSRLRNLILDNVNADMVAEGNETSMRGQLVSMSHVVDLLDTLRGVDPVKFAVTSVEADARARPQAQAQPVDPTRPNTLYRDGTQVQRDACPKCGLLIDMFGSGQMDWMASFLGGLGMMGLGPALDKYGLGGGSSALIMCPVCSPRESGRVYTDGCDMWRPHRHGEPSLWCREGTKHERVV